MLTSGQPQGIDNKEVTEQLHASCTKVGDSTQVADLSEPSAKTESDKSTESTPKPKQRGGKRPGAGRKPNIANRLIKQVTRETAGEILSSLDAPAIFRDIFNHGSRPLKLQAWIALNDRYFGKPRQDVGVAVSGSVTHVRDSFLSSLPKEALEALARAYDEVLAKYSTPVLDVAQDAPQNQIESKPAIEAEIVESEGLSA